MTNTNNKWFKDLIKNNYYKYQNKQDYLWDVLLTDIDTFQNNVDSSFLIKNNNILNFDFALTFNDTLLVDLNTTNSLLNNTLTIFEAQTLLEKQNKLKFFIDTLDNRSNFCIFGYKKNMLDSEINSIFKNKNSLLFNLDKFELSKDLSAELKSFFVCLSRVVLTEIINKTDNTIFFEGLLEEQKKELIKIIS